MRLLSQAAAPEEARRIVDALLIAGIEAQVRSEAGTEIWIVDHDDLERAREKLEAFRRDGFPEAAAASADLRRKQRLDREQHEQRVHDIRGRWLGRSYAPGIVTIFLIAASVAVGLLDLFSEPGGERMWNLTIDHWQSTEPLARVRAGEVWRLVTPIFLHFGLFHLGFNMMWVWSLGNQVEHNHGSLALVGLVLASALAGNLGQYAVTGPGFGGMSGVVYALFGFVWMNARFNRRYAYSIDDTNTVLIMLWFVACATGGFGPIANIGHGAGLVVGLFAGLPPYVRHLRAKADIPNLEAGGWADVHLTGLRRFRRRFVTPFVPLWFLAVAGLVIAAEPLTKDDPYDVPEACERFASILERCDATVPEAHRAALEAELDEALSSREQAEPDETDLERLCVDALEAVTPIAASHGCLKE